MKTKEQLILERTDQSARHAAERAELNEKQNGEKKSLRAAQQPDWDALHQTGGGAP